MLGLARRDPVAHVGGDGDGGEARGALDPAGAGDGPQQVGAGHLELRAVARVRAAGVERRALGRRQQEPVVEQHVAVAGVDHRGGDGLRVPDPLGDPAAGHAARRSLQVARIELLGLGELAAVEARVEHRHDVLGVGAADQLDQARVREPPQLFEQAGPAPGERLDQRAAQVHHERHAQLLVHAQHARVSRGDRQQAVAIRVAVDQEQLVRVVHEGDPDRRPAHGYAPTARSGTRRRASASPYMCSYSPAACVQENSARMPRCCTQRKRTGSA